MSSREAAGYKHPLYARSLSEFGEPVSLPASGGMLLRRPIPRTEYNDLMGCYPLFSCIDWSMLESDLEAVSDELISVGLVADPFGDYDLDLLHGCFPDKMIPFKKHLIADLKEDPNKFVSKHHRYYARKALREVSVEEVGTSEDVLDTWCALYDVLIERHRLKGMKAFSRECFRQQMAVPGIVVLAAKHLDKTIGMHLWYLQGDIAYSHLQASSEHGYSLNASYALYWRALELFQERIRWLDVGAASGTGHNTEDGLSKFKAGWANESRWAYFCGRILNIDRYRTLTRESGQADSAYFPVYRTGEFS